MSHNTCCLEAQAVQTADQEHLSGAEFMKVHFSLRYYSSLAQFLAFLYLGDDAHMVMAK